MSPGSTPRNLPASGSSSGSPDPGDVARRVAGAMVVQEPVQPLGWAVARDDAGRPLYLVAVVMGSQNIPHFETALRKLRPVMKPVDIFDNTPEQPPGQPPDAPPPTSPSV